LVAAVPSRRSIRASAAVDFVENRLTEYRTATGMKVPFSAYLATAMADDFIVPATLLDL